MRSRNNNSRRTCCPPHPQYPLTCETPVSSLAVRTPSSKSKPPEDPLKGFLPKGDPSRPYLLRRPDSDRSSDVVETTDLSSGRSEVLVSSEVVEAELVAEPSLPEILQEPNLIAEPTLPVEPTQPDELASSEDEIAPPVSVDIPSPMVVSETTSAPVSTAPPIVTPNSRTNVRRSRTKKTPVLLYLASAGMAVIVGVLAYFVLGGNQRLQLAKDGSSISLATKPGGSDSLPRQRDDAEVTITVPDDGPMPGTIASASPKSSSRNSNSLGPSLASDLNASAGDSPNISSLPMPGMAPSIVSEEPVPPPPSMAEDAPTVSDAPVRPPTMDPPPDAMKIAKGRELMVAAFDAVSGGDLQTMSLAVEQAVSNAGSPDQQQLADQYQQLVDLAKFYDGAVDRTLDQLQAAQMLNITPSLIASVVEASADRLVLKINGTNKRFQRASLPLVLIDHLAADSLDAGGATTLAAKSAYHAVAKVAGTARHRQQAIGWLRTLDESETEVDVAGVASAINDLLRGYLSGGDGQ